jgi:hypothetical protein
MPLVVNGVTIPQNVANSLMVNGVSVTQVIANGVTVWTQSLFSATWSGNSTSSFSYGSGVHNYILETSGSAHRWAYNGNNSGLSATPSAWVYVDSSGQFTSGDYTLTVTLYATTKYGARYSGNNIQGIFYNGFGNAGWGSPTGWVTFNPSSGFSGTTYALAGAYKYQYLTTSSGMISYKLYIEGTYSQGAWISLT